MMMARDYGKLYIKIWSNRDFISLPASAQRTYMFLTSQPDLSNAGTITIALRRWAKCVGDQDADGILDDLRVLASRRFVVVDMDCEELLIRSYIKWDGGWKSPNMMISIKGTAQQVLSETIRAVIRGEISRLDTSHLPAKVNERTGRSTKDFIELLISQLEDSLDGDDVDDAVLDWGKGAELDDLTHSERVKQDEINPLPNPLRNPSVKGSLTTTATAIDSTAIDTTATAIDTTSKKADSKRETYPDDFERFWQTYPLKNGKSAAFKAFRKALRKAASSEIIEGARRYRDDPNRDPGYTKYPQGWLNDGRWADGPLPTKGATAVGYLTKSQKAQAEWDEDRRIRAELESEQRGGGRLALTD
jgi:hypothetical protein